MCALLSTFTVGQGLQVMIKSGQYIQMIPTGLVIGFLIVFGIHNIHLEKKVKHDTQTI